MFSTIRKWLRSYHNPAIPLSSPDIGEYFGTTTSRSGEPVTTDTALMYSPVWQAVDLITSDISRIPFVTYERTSSDFGDGKVRSRLHPAYRLLRRYTGEMTANMWLVRMVGHALLHGNAYTRLKFSGNKLSGFEWLHSDRVEPRKVDGIRTYIVQDDPIDDHSERLGLRRVAESRMFHLEGLTVSQLGGLSIINYARNTIGRAIAAEGFGDDYYVNGGPSVVFSHPGQMTHKAQKNFLKSFQKRHAGAGNRFRYGVVEEGMKADQIGVSAEDAMLIDALKFSVRDVARYFNVPPHKLGDDSRTSFNSTEQENMSYFNSSLGKWTSRLEFEANQKLFTKQQRDEDTHFAEFKVDALFKANTIDRMQAAAIAVTNGIKNRNEVRAEENLNPYEGGEEFLTPLNLSQGEDVIEVDEDTQPDETPSRMLLVRDVMIDACERATTRVFIAATRAANKPDKFAAWLNDIDAKHRKAVTDALSVSLRAGGASEADVTRYVDEFMAFTAGRLLEASEGNLGQIGMAQQAVMSHCRQKIDELLWCTEKG